MGSLVYAPMAHTTRPRRLFAAMRLNTSPYMRYLLCRYAHVF